MQIDILKAVEGISYPIKGEEIIPDDLFLPREIRAGKPAEIKGEYRVEDGAVMVSLHINLPLVALCDRCLDEVTYRLSCDTDAYFTKNPDEDDGTYPYSGYLVDISGVITSEILFRLPVRILCKKDCKGLCPVCGTNRNREDCICASHTNEGSPFDILNQTIAGGANDGSTKT